MSASVADISAKNPWNLPMQLSIVAYESALKTANNGDMKVWIQQKLEFLKGKHTVTVLEPQNVTGRDLDGGQK